MHKAGLEQGRFAAKRRVNNSAFFDLLWPSLTFFGRFCHIWRGPRPMLQYFAKSKSDFAVFCDAQSRFAIFCDGQVQFWHIWVHPRTILQYFAMPKANVATSCHVQTQFCRILPRPRRIPNRLVEFYIYLSLSRSAALWGTKRHTAFLSIWNGA